jgi:ferredoxin
MTDMTHAAPLPQDENGEVLLPHNLPEDISMKIRKGGKIRRIVVDRQGCIGARSCVVVAPGVFQMDAENLAYVTDPDAEDEDTILMAAQSCPTLAIHLYDKDGNKIFPES